MDQAGSPPALQAVAAHPHLYSQVARSLIRQASVIAARMATFTARPAAIVAIDEAINSVAGGLITLEAPSTGGATTLLCQLAATRTYAFWLPEEEPDGIEALCGQILALTELSVPLVPPTARRDSITLERLMAEAGASRPPGDPLVIVVGQMPDTQHVAIPRPFPAIVPPGVILLMACTPGETPPIEPAARISLPDPAEQIDLILTRIATHHGSSRDIASRIAAHSQGSFLYPRLAAGLLTTRMLRSAALPEGIGALHTNWWNQLGATDRRLAMLIAAAGEPVDMSRIAALAELTPEETRRRIQRWHAMLADTDGAIQFYHTASQAFVALQSGDQLAGAHAAFVMLARSTAGLQQDRAGLDDPYFAQQLARHIALSDSITRNANAPSLSSRVRVFGQERYTGTMHTAAHDLAWELRAAADDGPLLRMVRSATLSATLTLLARTLPPDAPAETLAMAIEQGQPREGVLKRIRSMVEQLPAGTDKALVLRRLGEVCYTLRMRAPAMRMLSEALDLEAHGLPRAWRDDREETLVALARAAVMIGAPDTALGITTRIVHAERRGMIETEVVRWLIGHNQHTRAEEVAYAIRHNGTHEWAMAEVAVGHMRAGDQTRARIVLDTLKTQTALVWAWTTLAADAAYTGDSSAADRLGFIQNTSLRDRALAQVALALAENAMIEPAIEAARQIENHEVRARGLIDLAAHDPLGATRCLAEASISAAAITGEERAPVLVALAAALAAADKIEAAMSTADTLPEGEERDRAQSRIAVALGRSGDFAAAGAIAAAIQDDDERAWALDELAHLVGQTGNWHEGFDLASQISNPEQLAHAEADLTIAWARAGMPVAAHARADQIAISAEQARAKIAIIAPLVAAGARAGVFTTIAQFQEPGFASRYQATAAMALAAYGVISDAQAITRVIARPLEKARALVAIARAAANENQALASSAIGEALRIAATLGRAEVFICLSLMADALATLGGAELLFTVAGALNEIDGWWT